jgi:hypothetical protein
MLIRHFNEKNVSIETKQLENLFNQADSVLVSFKQLKMINSEKEIYRKVFKLGEVK